MRKREEIRDRDVIFWVNRAGTGTGRSNSDRDGAVVCGERKRNRLPANFTYIDKKIGRLGVY